MLPAAFVFVLGVNLYLEGEPLRARQGSSHVLGVAAWQGPAGGTMLPHRPLQIICNVRGNRARFLRGGVRAPRSTAHKQAHCY